MEPRRENGPMRRRSERYTVKDMAAALGAAPNTVRRHLRSCGVYGGSGWRHEWDAAQFRRLLEIVGRRIAEGVPASRGAHETEDAGAGMHGGLQEVQSVFEMPETPAGIEEMQISTFKATCLAVLERVGKTGQPVLVTRYEPAGGADRPAALRRLAGRHGRLGPDPGRPHRPRAGRGRMGSAPLGLAASRHAYLALGVA